MGAIALAALMAALGCELAGVRESPSPDRAALTAIYNATGGANWRRDDNWLSDKPIDEWHGVHADDDGLVLVLDLAENELNGEIPSEIGDLANLEKLYLSGNRLSGCVSGALLAVKSTDRDELGLSFCPEIIAAERDALIALYESTDGANWTRNNRWLSDKPIEEWLGVSVDGNGRVTTIRLSSNNLSGTIPPEIGDIPNLERLWLFENNLSGEIPPEIGKLSHLMDLSLYDNRLSGEIPPEMGNLSRLIYLHFGNNRLIGEIPAEIGGLSRLIELGLSGNRLSGEIPPEMGSLVNLTSLGLVRNRLSGGIPPEIGDIPNLYLLNLADNQLSGAIPPELGNLAYLSSWRLSGNQLTGCVPAAWRDIEYSEYNDFAKIGLPFCEP